MTRQLGLGPDHNRHVAQARRPPVAPRRPPERILPMCPRVEPLPELDWAMAVDPGAPAVHASCPLERRRAWVHTGEEHQVLGLYDDTARLVGTCDVPWWVRAVAEGRLGSRAEGFEFEDAVHALLTERQGWVFVPWVRDGEDPYWEFEPSEPEQVGGHPTTMALTCEHDGWLDVLPPGNTEERLPLDGVAGLAGRLPEIETWRADLPRPRT
ncbi:hypothetical protein GCM10012275_42340 [Longimycelium tulufanense]|uniref:Uncharacterized protein n=1 Tax=Longimycelium tulufanense TaxID=907463 RepID=A0A8J3CAX1_9PSEU|nr:hypothetical protein [Longimycelium tulufanense]GGM67301.1 hypothetical protein GCM10012275_42340 [Longimycelium tulufanense]